MPTFNEQESVRRLISAIPRPPVDDVVVVNDGSTDATSGAARASGAVVVDRKVRGGPGPAIRDGLEWLRGNGYDVVVIMASTGKHSPAEIQRLLDPIANEGADMVFGSRHLPGGHHENMPWHRLALIHVFTFLVSALLGRRVTDATGGFRAYRLAVLNDPRIDIHQDWLGRYGLETYLYARTLMGGYRWKEVPVTVTYPGGKKRYTRARPILDWWSYFRPVILLRLGLKR